MENKVELFSFESKQVRVVLVEGEPWFVAKDVADILGYVFTVWFFVLTYQRQKSLSGG